LLRGNRSVSAPQSSAACRDRDLRGCLEAGSLAAAEVISHFGARPEANLKEIVQL